MLIERMRKRLAAERASFIEPCLPSPADKPPSGSNWIHEIKHDGFRLMARRDPVGIRLITRRGNDWTARYPLVVEAVNHFKVRSCLIDGEVVCCDEPGLGHLPVVPTQAERAAGIPLRLRPVGAERGRPTEGADRGAQGDPGEHPSQG
jgi:ATP-dependent DNA ligase